MSAIQFGTITTQDIQPGFAFKGERNSDKNQIFVVTERSGSAQHVPAGVIESTGTYPSIGYGASTRVPYTADVFEQTEDGYFTFKKTAESPVHLDGNGENANYSPVDVKITGKKLLIEG